MSKSVFLLIWQAVLLLLTCNSVLLAEEPKFFEQTRVYAPDLHCEQCLTIIEAELRNYPSFVRVEGNFKDKIVTVYQRGVLSPKVIWDAVEKGHAGPKTLTSSKGTFSSRPMQ